MDGPEPHINTKEILEWEWILLCTQPTFRWWKFVFLFLQKGIFVLRAWSVTIVGLCCLLQISASSRPSCWCQLTNWPCKWTLFPFLLFWQGFVRLQETAPQNLYLLGSVVLPIIQRNNSSLEVFVLIPTMESNHHCLCLKFSLFIIFYVMYSFRMSPVMTLHYYLFFVTWTNTCLIIIPPVPCSAEHQH